MVYVLFNFKDKPFEAEYRMRECLRLGVNLYPTQYVPLDKKTKSNTYIGKFWTKKLQTRKLGWTNQIEYLN